MCLHGWVSQSFKRYSTAGIFKDDYDLLMHPEDITDVEKNLLYTAFSGFSTIGGSWYGEKILGGTDFNTYFLGGTFIYKDWRPVLLFEYYNDSDEENDYDKSSVYSSWSTGMNNYRILTETFTSYSNYDKRKIFKISLGLGKKSLFFDTSGIIWNHSHAIYDDRPNSMSSPPFGKIFTENSRSESIVTDLSNNKISLYTLEECDFYNYNGDISEEIIVGTEYGNLEGHLSLSMTFDDYTDDEYSYIKKNITDETNIFEETITGKGPYNLPSTYYYNTPFPSFNWRTGLYAEYFLPCNVSLIENMKKEIFLIGGSVNFSRDTIRDETKREEEQKIYNNPLIGNTSQQINKNNEEFETDSNYYLSSSGKIKRIFFIGNNVRFGSEFRVSFNTMKNKIIVNREKNYVRYQDNDGDNKFDSVNDSVTTTVSKEKENHEYKFFSYSISLPLGIEIDLIRRLVFRLGSDLRYNHYTRHTLITTEDTSPQAITYTDGQGNKTAPSSYSSKASIEDYDEWSDSNTYNTFYYGAGLAVNDNFHIDLMSFAGTSAGQNLFNLNNWSISVIINWVF